jgi:hypothetical protein
MPIVVEQQIQAPEPMTANTSAITSQQPVNSPFLPFQYLLFPTSSSYAQMLIVFNLSRSQHQQ